MSSNVVRLTIGLFTSVSVGKRSRVASNGNKLVDGGKSNSEVTRVGSQLNPVRLSVEPRNLLAKIKCWSFPMSNGSFRV